MTKGLFSCLPGVPSHDASVNVKKGSEKIILDPLRECHGLNVARIDQRLDTQVHLISCLGYQGRDWTRGAEGDQRTVKHLRQVEEHPGDGDDHIHLLASFDYSLYFLDKANN